MTQGPEMSGRKGPLARRWANRIVGLTFAAVVGALCLWAEGPIPVIAWLAPLIVVWFFTPWTRGRLAAQRGASLEAAADVVADTSLLLAAAMWLGLLAFSLHGATITSSAAVAASSFTIWMVLRFALVPWVVRALKGLRSDT